MLLAVGSAIVNNEPGHKKAEKFQFDTMNWTSLGEYTLVMVDTLSV